MHSIYTGRFKKGEHAVQMIVSSSRQLLRCGIRKKWHGLSFEGEEEEYDICRPSRCTYIRVMNYSHHRYCLMLINSSRLEPFQQEVQPELLMGSSCQFSACGYIPLLIWAGLAGRFRSPNEVVDEKHMAGTPWLDVQRWSGEGYLSPMWREITAVDCWIRS